MEKSNLGLLREIHLGKSKSLTRRFVKSILKEISFNLRQKAGKPMKKIFIPFTLIGLLILPNLVKADGLPEEPRPVRRHHVRNVPAPEIPPPAPVCVPSSDHPKVKLVSWDPVQKVSKILGVIQECVTNQWDVIKLLSGPNTIGLHYPDEKEMWGYQWLWSYKLKNPIEDTLIFMDYPGKRLMKGKNPVELYITYNQDDVVERVEMILVKKRDSRYVIFP